MKNIAILCDGTWQDLGQPIPTNVAKLARTIEPRSADGAIQVVYYDDGVGVGHGVLDAATHLIGGAFGQGLDYKIGRAYEFLCLNYEPGDRIFIFGFSRGAYTARSLAGLVRWAWILKRENVSEIGAATALYRSRPPHGSVKARADAFEAQAAQFRAGYCHPAEAFIDDMVYDPKDPGSLAPGPGCAWIQYVGVWDTVGALGVPTNLPFANLLDAQYAFHDASLSRFVRSGRHAVAIDEKRHTFQPALWDNIAAQNTHAGADGLTYDARPYQQCWFPGHHGSVGGGSDDGGLALIPMLWVAEGAMRAGLSLACSELDEYARIAHPDAKIAGGFSIGQLLTSLDGVADRIGPAAFEEVSLSAKLRWARLPAYRPAPLIHLAAVSQGLDAWRAPLDPQVYYRA